MALDKNAVVVMASSMGTDDAVQGALKAGAKNFLQKPIDQDGLLKVLCATVSSLQENNMSAKFIGQFLLEKGLITREALLAATEHQQRVNLTLGALAVAQGLLSTAQADVTSTSSSSVVTSASERSRWRKIC